MKPGSATLGHMWLDFENGSGEYEEKKKLLKNFPSLKKTTNPQIQRSSVNPKAKQMWNHTEGHTNQTAENQQ